MTVHLFFILAVIFVLSLILSFYQVRLIQQQSFALSRVTKLYTTVLLGITVVSGVSALVSLSHIGLETGICLLYSLPVVVVLILALIIFSRILPKGGGLQ